MKNQFYKNETHGKLKILNNPLGNFRIAYSYGNEILKCGVADDSIEFNFTFINYNLITAKHFDTAIDKLIRGNFAQKMLGYKAYDVIKDFDTLTKCDFKLTLDDFNIKLDEFLQHQGLSKSVDKDKHIWIKGSLILGY